MKKFLTVFSFIFLFHSSANAVVSFAINGGEVAKSKILFFGFNQANADLRVGSFEIFERTRRNLNSTDLFQVIRHDRETLEGSDLEEIDIETIPDFKKYQDAAISAIIVAKFNHDTVGNIEMKVRMWDVLDERQLFGKFYTASKDKYRKVSNLFSDEIFKSMTGEKIGHFNSQILYVSESGKFKKRTKKITIIGFDGEGERYLTDGDDLVLTPIFSKKRDEIFYLRYFKKIPQIFTLNLNSLRTKKLGGFRGTTFSASKHPINDNKILLSSIVKENTDIYEFDVNKNQAKRLTKNPAIDTTASYSPDGKLITFASNRDNSQQLYVMNSNLTNIKKITSSPGSYSKPIFSPDGKLITFTKFINDEFHIGLISINGENETILTSGYLVEGARFSPSGRYIIYSKKRAAYGYDSIPKLFITDIITGHEYEIKTPRDEGATDPDWL